MISGEQFSGARVRQDFARSVTSVQPKHPSHRSGSRRDVATQLHLALQILDADFELISNSTKSVACPPSCNPKLAPSVERHHGGRAPRAMEILPPRQVNHTAAIAASKSEAISGRKVKPQHNPPYRLRSCGISSGMSKISLNDGPLGQDKEEDRGRKSGDRHQGILDIPDDIPQDVIDRADCVVVLPSVLKFAFGLGGSYGRG